MATRGRGRPATRRGQATGPVTSLDRGLLLLTALSEADGLTLSDLAQRVGLAPSTVHRLLATLEQRCFVQQDETSQRWTVGVAAFTVGSAFLRERKLATAGRPVMQALMQEVGETVNLGVADEGEVVYVTQVESHAPMRAFFRPGRRAPMHSSAIGKALLAEISDAALRDILQHHGLPRFTERTIDSPAGLRSALDQVRARGWAVDDEEHTPGMRCVAATVHDEYGAPIAAVSLSGPSVRLTETRLGELGARIVRAAAEITGRLGGRAPSSPRAAAAP